MTQAQILRILDANFNRSREGLRVCEEILRFVLADKALTARIKKARHEVSDCLNRLSIPIGELIQARDVRSDVGKKVSHTEKIRRDAVGIFLANVERVKESLRVLEEASKLMDGRVSGQRPAGFVAGRIKKIRFQIYAIEKKA